MEQILIKVGSEDTSTAIKEFAGRFADASISVLEEFEEGWYEENYGMDKASFENSLNIGIAQSVLGMTKSWKEVRAELTARILTK